VALVDSGGGTTSAASTTTTAPPPTTGAATTTVPAGPPCTAAAISQAIQNAGDQPTSVDAPQCGDGWAGTDYSTHGEDVAALFKAQGGQWVDVDRSQNCNDPSIPANVHVFCTVS
jgi:hypothetical protein